MENPKDPETIKTPMITEAEEKALQVEAEIERLLEIGKEWTVDELGEESPLIYDIIFDNYDPQEENGISTNKYSMLETENESETFIIKKI
jgi:hypothetical protein